MKLRNIIILPLIAASISACYYDNYEDLYKNYSQECDTSNVGYAADIQAIIVTNCAVSGCHVGSNPQSGLDLAQFAQLKTIADDGRLTGRITGSSGAVMPPGAPLPSCEIEKIKKWVQEGALNN